ncbi:hypothetical protein FACS1894147_03110 [Spirochaetia bacterium]|nr:hypothetical protein FACS1894147_03110 [Spirochaetia bacterium]
MKKAVLLAVFAVLSFSFVAAQDRGAVEITGSGVNGRVLHKDIIRQNARPGDYIMVFNGIKLNAPQYLTQIDIDYSKSQYKEITEELLDTSPGSVRALLDQLVERMDTSPGSLRALLDESVERMEERKPADDVPDGVTEPEEVNFDFIRGKVIEFISDMRDGQQIILIVTANANREYFDSYYPVPPWNKEIEPMSPDQTVFLLTKRIDTDRNEIFCMTEDIQVTKTLIKKIIATPPPPPPPQRTTGGANLMTEFRVGSVTAAFNAIHEFLQTCNGKPNSADVIRSRIRTGDYLDLPALTVQADAGGGGFSAVNTSLGEHGTLLRLIVVGVDSFGKTNSGAPAHVVFQFQNVPVDHRMNPTVTNAGGYAKSEMRSYLTTRFLPGMVAAGLPESIIWAPTRYIANGGEKATAADALADKLWLPTEMELFGSNAVSNKAYETAQNQARLEFYDSTAKRMKYNLEYNGDYGMWYWEASPYSASAAYFCNVNSYGDAYNATASAVGGCAPAFCVR